ncbi:AarF/UbiB family protein [Mesorhizobium sp. M0006]|uniref:ABC1 kinase family protein n=1 Tax=Mesorhizobium sp. M0006 TaxID=2956838 RepID=UPI00333B2AC1
MKNIINILVVSSQISYRIINIFLLIFVTVASAAPRLLFHFSRRDRIAVVTNFGILLAKLAEKIGPSAVKLVQVASYRRDLLPLELTAPLSRLQDQVDPPSRRAVKKVLRHAYGAALSDVFETIEYRPFACGSVAVVVRARLRGGCEVALKILRPGARKRIELDLKIMRWVMSTIVARLERFDGVPIAQIFDRFAELVVGQCDMALEARSAERLRGLLDPDIVIPRPLLDQSRPTVLVTTYVSNVARFDSAMVSQEVYEHACVVLLKNVYAMIFVHGFVHGDLHPGNVGINSQGQVVLYDFGLVAELADTDRVIFRDFFLAVAAGDSVIVGQKILESVEHNSNFLDKDEFGSAVDILVKQYSGQKAGDFFVARFVEDLFDLQRRFGLYGTPGFANAVWALAMFEGLARHGHPALDFQREARSFFVASFMKTFVSPAPVVD